jgi:dipeptidyl aminopeptidase/acylaminoacyl peptidase
MLGAMAAVFACTATEPRDEPAAMPDIVYTERDSSTGLWSIQGYTDEDGVREIAPGQMNLPRPVHDFLIVRPTTGELLYISHDPGHTGYILLNPRSGEFRQLEFPGFSVHNWSPTGDLLWTYYGDSAQAVTLEGAVFRATNCPPATSCGAPHWAPSGDAFVSFRRPAGGEADLWLTPLAGGPAVNLTQTADASEVGGSYSSDGRHIVYQRDPGFELVVSNADGSDARPLAAPVDIGDFPWSPDGLRLAVVGRVGGQWGLALVPLDGAPRIITPPTESMLGLVPRIAWSPDGTRLAYSAWESQVSDAPPGVFVINVTGSGRRQLNRRGNDAYLGAWLPDLP